jgi:hypothetical protein
MGFSLARIVDERLTTKKRGLPREGELAHPFRGFGNLSVGVALFAPPSCSGAHPHPFASAALQDTSRKMARKAYILGSPAVQGLRSAIQGGPYSFPAALPFAGRANLHQQRKLRPAYPLQAHED